MFEQNGLSQLTLNRTDVVATVSVAFFRTCFKLNFETCRLEKVSVNEV